MVGLTAAWRGMNVNRCLSVGLLLLASTLRAETPQLESVAGNGVAGYAGDSGPATAAELNLPANVAVDGSDDIFVADSGNQRIRKIDRGGMITTIAGTGSAGYSGDGGPARSARLFVPGWVAVDNNGNLYIADTYNNRIRKVDTNGTITTVAGTGAAGYSGDSGPAASALLNGPACVAVDKAGNLYVTDGRNSRIRKVDTKGTITTVAGTGVSGYSGDGGASASALLDEPSGIAVDAEGNLFIADSANHRVRMVDTVGKISTIAGTGKAGYSGDNGSAASASLTFPTEVMVDAAENIYIADSGNHCIRKVDIRGTITTIAGRGTAGYSGDGGPAVSATLNFPAGMAADAAGNLYFADQSNNRIRRISAP